MARKRRGRPRKKSQFTYDSKETKFILGLLALALAVFTFLSYLITQDQSLFAFLRSLFGDATFMLAFLSFNLALSLFGLSYMFSSRQSLVSQFLILISLGIVISANSNPLLRQDLSYSGGLGGIVGFELASFFQNFIFLNLTAGVFIILIILLLPSMFSQSLAEFFGNVGTQIGELIKLITGSGKDSKSEKNQSDSVAANSKAAQQSGKAPSMFSHFRQGGKDQTTEEQPQSAAHPKPGKQQQAKPDAEQSDSGPEFVGLSSAPAGEKIEQKQINVINRSSEESESVGPKYPDWQLPPLDLLDPAQKVKVKQDDVEANKTIIKQTLQSFGIESEVMEVRVGPSVTQYALDIALGTKVSKISNLKNDLALALATAANSVRIEAPIPGTSYVGIEVPNLQRTPVFFRELMESAEINNSKYKLGVSVGKDIGGGSVVADIQKMPHLLIAGATGSGKSVLTNSFIMSILMKRSPDEVKFILVDPKQVELSDYNDIPHLLTPVIVDMEKVQNALKWAVDEMERRYTVFRESKVRNLEGYNEMMAGEDTMPYICIVIDEMADMMLTAGRAEVEQAIVRLAQKARATGIHLLLATQRPSVNVITGIIKANIPGRIGMSVTTQMDSRVILDFSGAESLLGKGDMLYKAPDSPKPNRVQGVYISQEEIQRVVSFIKDQTDEVEYIEDITVDKEAIAEAAGAVGSASGDNMFADAVRIIVSEQKGSASLLQRRMSIGYNRAAKLIEEMEELGVVGPSRGSKPRDVLVMDAEGFLSQIDGPQQYQQ